MLFQLKWKRIAPGQYRAGRWTARRHDGAWRIDNGIHHLDCESLKAGKCHAQRIELRLRSHALTERIKAETTRIAQECAEYRAAHESGTSDPTQKLRIVRDLERREAMAETVGQITTYLLIN